jgi:hypothetical protein
VVAVAGSSSGGGAGAGSGSGAVNGAAAVTPAQAAELGSAPTLLSGTIAVPAPPSPTLPSALPSRRGRLVAAAAVVLIGGAVAVFAWRGRARNEERSAPTASRAAAAGIATGASGRSTADDPGAGMGQPGAAPGTSAGPAGAAGAVASPTAGSDVGAGGSPTAGGTTGAPPTAGTPGAPPAAGTTGAPPAAGTNDTAGDTVTILVTGVPPGTEVVTPDGIVLGKVPGKLVLAREDEPLALTFRARGFKPLQRDVTPRADATLELALEPARDGGKERRDKGDGRGKDGRGKDGRGKGKDDLEDFGE